MDEFWTWFTIIMGGGSVLIAIGSAVVALICTIVPLGLIGWFIYAQFKKRSAAIASAQTWRTVTGRVIQSRVEVHGGDTTTVEPAITYAYDVNGQTYQSSQFRAGDSVMRVTSGNAYQTVDKYPVGAIVQVFYNPNNPSEAALER